MEKKSQPIKIGGIRIQTRRNGEVQKIYTLDRPKKQFIKTYDKDDPQDTKD